MQFFLKLLALIVFVFGISLSLLLLNKKNEEIKKYQDSLFGAKYDYVKLKTEYENYIEKTKNLRHLEVLSESSKSQNAKISEIIYQYATHVEGDLSIYYKDLRSNESVVIDGDRTYYMASLYKVILTIYILNEVKKGTIQLTDPVVIQDSPTITLGDALDKIVSESNNEYAVGLAEKYGWQTIEKAMKQKLHIDFTFNDALESSVRNMGTLFEEIALSLKLTDSESNYLLNLLKDQKKISKLPKYLPKNIYSHNKTGEFEDYSHDAGIFYTPKANYILLFMSKTKYPGETNELMSQMSKEIYEALNNPQE